MRKVFFALIFAFSSVNIGYASDADMKRYVEECLSVIDRPQVEITSSYGKLRYNYTKGKDFLRQETEEKFKASGLEMPEDFIPIGLTKVRDGFNFNLTVGQVEISRGYECVYPEKIEAHLGYYVPTIYVLKDLEKNSCMYEVALRHEKTHMQIYIEALDYFLPQFKDTAERLFEMVGVKIVAPGQQADVIAKELNAEYLQKLQEKVETWRKEVAVEQAKLDSIENYIVETKLCEKFDKGK